MNKVRSSTIALMFFIAANQAFAQEIPEPVRERIGPSRYYLGKEDELLIPVNIFGYVNKPGQYMVPNETDLIALVAFAGGFKDDAKLDKIQILRGGTPANVQATDGLMTNSNATNGHTTAIPSQTFKVDLKKYFATGDRNLIPNLMPDDTIIIKGSRAVTFKNILDFTARLSVLAQIYFYVQVAKDR